MVAFCPARGALGSRQTNHGSARWLLWCLVPAFDGAIFSLAWREALWAVFYTGAPRRQRQSSRRPFGRPISIVMSSPNRGREATSQDAAAGGEIVSGTKPVVAELLRRPLRYSRRQRVNNDRDNRYRRAVTEPFRKPCRLSSTIRTFSSSDQSRRRPRSSTDKTSMGEMIVAHDIRHGLKANQQVRTDGLRRMGTISRPFHI
ncbi:UNVERIFIED_ORG: hypothetical protein GGE63_006079 [Rhizobium esperanzae]